MGVTLNNNRVTSARAWLPSWGAWYAEASIDSEATLSGRVALVLNDLTLSGTVLSGGPDKGRSHYRIIGGAGGLGKVLPAKSRSDDAGVRVSALLADLAAESGETIDAGALAAKRLGPSFVRVEGSAARVLELVAPQTWYVDESGVVRVGRRARSVFEGKLDITSPVDKAQRSVTVASEAIVKLMPGITVAGIEAVDVLHEVTPEGIRSTLWGAWGGATVNRRLAALKRVIEFLFPSLRYSGVFEYRVVTQMSKRLGLQPVRSGQGLPNLQRVPVRPGVPGCDPLVILGSRVLVGFIGNDPSYPYVAGFEDLDGAGFTPMLLTLAGGSKGVAREDDSITITAAQLNAASGSNSGGPVAFANSAVGKITSASSKVRCG